MPKTRSVLLPLLDESINSTATVRHCIEIVQNITNNLNPTEKVIITADQPVHALGKQVQWMYQERYGNVLWMMGPLHIELAYMSATGDWIEDSGWVEALKKANVSTPGRIESFLTGSKVKRTRYAHQVSLATWIRLAQNAFEDQTLYPDYESWKAACLTIKNSLIKIPIRSTHGITWELYLTNWPSLKRLLMPMSTQRL